MNHRPPQSLQPNLSRMLRRAHGALGEGELSKAERLYAELLQHQPDNFDALHGLGQINYRRGRLDAALGLLQAALKTDLSPRRRLCQPWAGVSFAATISSGRLSVTTRACVSRRTMRSCSTGAAWRCWSLAARGRRWKASTGLLAAAPDHLDALGNRGNALLKLNRVAEALAAYDRALELAPNNAPLLTNRAVALRRLDRPHEALMSAQRALRSKPDFAPCALRRERRALNSGRFSRRLARLRSALASRMAGVAAARFRGAAMVGQGIA